MEDERKVVDGGGVDAGDDCAREDGDGAVSDDGDDADDDVEDDVNLTNSKVRQGLAELTKQYLGEDAELLDKINAEELEESEQISEVMAPTYSQLSAAQGRSFSFELETRDGDKVTINARSLEGFSRSQSSDGTGCAASFEREFALGSEGELDETIFNDPNAAKDLEDYHKSID